MIDLLGARAPRFALVAGELSGDLLGASLIEALRRRYPEASFYGVAGPKMAAAGCEVIESIETLSLFGLTEVLPAIPRLLKLRTTLVERISSDGATCVIGIDAPDFNLGLERRLRNRGMSTVHLVSPTVWAWRQGRVKTIARAVELMLCLFPFEPAFYGEHGVTAEYIGHPMADEIGEPLDRAAAREALGLPSDAAVIAVLPGSRGSELKYLGETFARAAAEIARVRPAVCFVTPIAKPGLRAGFEAAIGRHAPGLSWTLVDGRAREVMGAADAVLLASGTATLECLLVGRPMVVAYRASALTKFLMLDVGLLKSPHVSLPNLLCERAVVPELLQNEASPARLAREVLQLLDDPAARGRQLAQFDAVRERLRCGAADAAAAAIARHVID